MSKQRVNEKLEPAPEYAATRTQCAATTYIYLPRHIVRVKKKSNAK